MTFDEVLGGSTLSLDNITISSSVGDVFLSGGSVSDDVPACSADCAGVCSGDSWDSDCGCVAADNAGDDCDDCAGTPNGDAATDNCGTCDSDASNDCTQDCAGVWGGDS